MGERVKCECPKWAANIDAVTGPGVLQSLRSGGVYQYQGERFAYCPWCGRRLTTYESTPGAPAATPGGVP